MLLFSEEWSATGNWTRNLFTEEVALCSQINRLNDEKCTKIVSWMYLDWCNLESKNRALSDKKGKVFNPDMIWQ